MYHLGAFDTNLEWFLKSDENLHISPVPNKIYFFYFIEEKKILLVYNTETMDCQKDIVNTA